jgi:hypothetical protein
MGCVGFVLMAGITDNLRVALCDLCETLCKPRVKPEAYTEFHKDYTELHRGNNLSEKVILGKTLCHVPLFRRS